MPIFRLGTVPASIPTTRKTKILKKEENHANL